MFKNTIFCAFILLASCFKMQAQIALSTPLFAGKDSESIAANWSAELQVFHPILLFTNVNDTAKNGIGFLLQPGIKWEWYNFRNNLVVNRANNFTSFMPDQDPSHEYSDNRFFRTTSMMRSTSVYLPAHALLYTKKVKELLIMPGIYAEYLLGGEFRNRYKQQDELVVDRNKFKAEGDVYGFNRFQYGICSQVTYKFFTVYMNYSLVPLFEKEEGIEVNKFRVGIYFDFIWGKGYTKGY